MARGHPSASYGTTQARLLVVRAAPAEVDRPRALHQVPRGQHNRRPWLMNQAVFMTPDEKEPTTMPRPVPGLTQTT